MLARLLRFIFSNFFVKPLIYVLLGINVRRRQLLPKHGPAIIVANHNSHLDTIVLMCACEKAARKRLRPVAAADYFLKNKFTTWLSLKVMRIIPIKRHHQVANGDPLQPVTEALKQNDIVIIYPEGTRGEPEKLATFKKGIAHLAKNNPNVPITPVYMHGLGKALPKGEFLLVPFFCDVFVGESLTWTGDIDGFMAEITQRMRALANEEQFPLWE